MELDIEYHQKQEDFFFNLDTKYRIMTKGRRTGFTHGAANFLIESAPGEGQKFLWVDTIHANIDRYIDRYFRPTLKKLPSQMYDYNRQSKEMRICDTLIDFRSADRAENIEGFGYHKIILNEAGIILKGERGRYIWENAMLPMTMDYECTVFMGGTPKGIVDKTGKETIYYRLFQRASGNSPNWSTINVTTDENPYLNETSVREVQDELPEGPVRDQEFYGKFVQGGATVINPDLFQIVDAPLVGRAVRYWDMAVSVKKSADYSAGAKVCADDTGKMQVQDLKNVKMLWPDLLELIMATAEADGPEVEVWLETNGQQAGFVDELQREPRMAAFVVSGLPTREDKLSRAMRWVSRGQRGQITFLRGAWINGLWIQCRAFTADDTHANDDSIDAISGAYGVLSNSETGITVI